MFTLPSLKLEKGCDYLENQLQLQKNNKERILDIINNASSVSNEETNIKSSCYANLLEDANKVLETISTNISSIEKLNLELKTLNGEITNVMNSHPQKRKNKKFYTQLFPDLENNLDTYSRSFQEIENKILTDNIYFTEFMNKTNSSCDYIDNSKCELESEEFEEFNLDFPINSAFIEKINNTTSFDFEYIYYEESLDKLNSDDVLLLSLSLPDETNKISENIEISEECSQEPQNENSIISPVTDNQNVLEVKNETLTKDSYKEKIEKIESGVEDNKTLLISERLGKIYLPYKKSELFHCINQSPDVYESLQQVVKQKFILPFEFFKNQSSKSRFSEAYNLLKNRDGQNFIKSVSYAFKITGKRNLNPTIIASCKNKFELESYIYYLDSNNLNNFRFFDIIYEINPLKK